MLSILATVLALLLANPTVKLQWNAITNVTQFKVYRSTAVNGSTSCSSYTTTPIATVNNATIYTETVVPGMKYCYVVTAMYPTATSNGTTFTESDKSNEVFADIPVTTPPAVTITIQ